MMTFSNQKKDDQVSVIIVNYKSKKHLGNCLRSFFSKFEAIPEIIIVNNDPEEKLDEFQLEYPTITLINSQKNIGYGAANNTGARVAEGKYLFFLNPDTGIMEANTLTFLKKRLENETKSSIVSPQVIDENDNVQDWIAGRDVDFSELLLNNLGIKRSRKLWKSSSTIFVDWVSGAAMMVNKSDFFDVGGFDEGYFMYFEDIDLCKRLRTTGRKVIYAPECQVRHKCGGSFIDEKERKANYYKSQDHYFRKHYGETKAEAVRAIRKIFAK